jgi:hypothetical protein
MAVFGLQACLAMAGIWFLARSIRRTGWTVESGIATAVISSYPTLIAYQHILLTEIGSFFFLALIVSLLARPQAPSLKGAVVLGLAIGASFYHRSSLLYLSPLAGVIYTLNGRNGTWKAPKRAALHCAIITALPFAIAYPWLRMPAVSTRTGHVYLFGIVKQGVLPLNDPILGTAAPMYSSAIQSSKVNGVLPASGLAAGREMPVIDAVIPYVSSAGSVFLRSILADPPGYFQAVARNLTLFSGFGGAHYDNADYRDSVLSLTRSQIDPGMPGTPALGAEFEHAVTDDFVAAALRWLAPVYDWLIQFGLAATLVGFIVGVWRLDRAMVAFSAPAVAFMALHALLLVSQDRLILPCQPLFLLNLILLPSWLGIPARIVPFVRKVPTRVAIILCLLLASALLVPFLRNSAKTNTVSRENKLGVLDGFIDSINGPVKELPDDPSRPLRIAPAEPVVIIGWLSDRGPAGAIALDEVFGLVDGKPVKAEIVSRPDVSSQFHNAALANCGFRLKIDSPSNATGILKVEIEGRTKGNRLFHQYPHPIYLAFRQVPQTKN